MTWPPAAPMPVSATQHSRQTVRSASKSQHTIERNAPKQLRSALPTQTTIMSYVSSVIYPRRDGATFDMKYYIDHHMPLVDRHWKPAGLLKWEVVEFDSARDGSEAPFSVMALLTWKDQASYTTAHAGSGTAEILGDVPRFSTEKPTFISGRIVSSA